MVASNLNALGAGVQKHSRAFGVPLFGRRVQRGVAFLVLVQKVIRRGHGQQGAQTRRVARSGRAREDQMQAGRERRGEFTALDRSRKLRIAVQEVVEAWQIALPRGGGKLFKQKSKACP